jgi:hypothetical protein
MKSTRALKILNGKPPPPERIKKLSARNKLNARLVKLSTARCRLNVRSAARPLSHALPNAKRDVLLVKLRTRRESRRESPRKKSLKLKRLRESPRKQKRKRLVRPLMLKTRKLLRLKISLPAQSLLKLKPPRLILKLLLKGRRKRLNPSARENNVSLNLLLIRFTKPSKLRLLPKRRRKKRFRR